MTTGSLDEPVSLHTLTFLAEDDEVTVGRVDTGEYVVLPADGGQLLQRLTEGLTQRAAAQWYLDTYGEQVDVADFVADLAELGFLRAADEAAPGLGPVRWHRLGKAVFSPVAGLCLAVLLAAWCALMVRYPAFVPSYRQAFFTHYVTVIELVLFLGQIPLLLLHESAHALAGRRLGLPTSLSISYRLYYVVFETSMDALVGVERRKRYLPMLAGMLTDLAVCAVLNVVAWLTLGSGGTLSPVGRVALAFSFSTLLRVLWQFYFYLETDLYYVAVTVMRCVDLHTVARQMLRNRFLRLLRSDRPPADEALWHPRDRAVARWYSWLMLGGYAFTLGVLVVVLVPSAIRMAALCIDGLRTGQAARETDVAVFLALNVAQLALIVYLAIRNRRRRRASPSAA